MGGELFLSPSCCMRGTPPQYWWQWLRVRHGVTRAGTLAGTKARIRSSALRQKGVSSQDLKEGDGGIESSSPDERHGVLCLLCKL